MKIALLGYGKMGRYIEQLATQAGHQVVLRVDEHNRDRTGVSDLEAADVAIEFSRPDAAVNNIELALAAGVPIVVGTTGWLDALPAVRLRVEQAGGALFYASNFSIGVNLFFSAARDLARKLAHEGYTARIEETHHTEKLDAPSGTALTLQQKIGGAFPKAAIPIESFREPDVPGTHRLIFQSAVDTIELTHTARSREGFARGALAAAAWLVGKQGTFTMSDLLQSE
ncbi:4-hydroxy-tetrahydrodipicolinate reductase [Neolewinella litorea]|uniref:4-hydroxy-tetrahydrodipicolinate reductase n=1 Tax=Neolewinella litorea TaxID=2562452 RepID=A0A4V3XLK0_9BACT|nr:dihydrodipicolinate reductase C-terminal domain-containing protein [Neolewinella litorea]THH41113.1 4-hydroxy-tetrahydrodipicolinate reductase [Neolewinella litorea]